MAPTPPTLEEFVETIDCSALDCFHELSAPAKPDALLDLAPRDAAAATV